MAAIFTKLQYKGQSPILVLRAPESFASALGELDASVHVRTQARGRVAFAIAFVTNEVEITKLTTKVVPLLEEDAILRFAYPKKSSKRYQSDIDRDHGWQALGDSGFEGVRQVAIDEDWSALRFRQVEHIKTMTRGFAMSAAGKKRTKRKR